MHCRLVGHLPPPPDTGERLKLIGSHVSSTPDGFPPSIRFVESRTHKSCISSSPVADVNTSSSPITWFAAKTRTVNVQLSTGNVLLAATHILVLHVFEQPQLPVSPLSKNLRLERPVQLLNGHFLFSPLIYG